jgi:hypothetical protein
VAAATAHYSKSAWQNCDKQPACRYDGAMPRFVLLRHELPPENPRGTHFDLMLEQAGALRTWACERIPGPAAGPNWEGEAPAEPARQEPRPPIVMADQLPDHRLAYLDYEGPVSGNRGSVTRIDAGECGIVAETAEKLEVQLAGQVLCGLLTLSRESPKSQRWSVVFSPAGSCE